MPVVIPQCCGIGVKKNSDRGYLAVVDSKYRAMSPEKYQTVSIAAGLLDELPKLEPKTALILSKLAPAEIGELVRRLKDL
jgi:hypothetical protein